MKITHLLGRPVLSHCVAKIAETCEDLRTKPEHIAEELRKNNIKTVRQIVCFKCLKLLQSAED